MDPGEKNRNKNKNTSIVRLNHWETEQSDESVLVERLYGSSLPGIQVPCPHSLHEFSSRDQLDESGAAYFSWPASSQLNDAAEERAEYFCNQYKIAHPCDLEPLSSSLRASTLLDLMMIRAFHSNFLRRFSLGTALGFRVRKGLLTDIPAIIVFVAHKVHKQWLNNKQRLPTALEGPGGVWCDVDVLEFSYHGVPATTSNQQISGPLVDALRGSDPLIGSGSQVASHESYGTLGAIVRRYVDKRQVGFLTNRHVAVDLDYPSQKMFHPLPRNLGPGVHLGDVERATSYITDESWYGLFAGPNPETFVRADGAFVPFADGFDATRITTGVRGVGEMGAVHVINLQDPIGTVVGRRVVKVGRSSGLTTGTVTAYALEYNDEKGICFLTDFLVIGEDGKAFDLEGDSGSLILLVPGEDGEKPRPVGIIWGGISNRGSLKLTAGGSLVSWTSGVDLRRLLHVLNLDLVRTDDDLRAALVMQREKAENSKMSSSPPQLRPQPVECDRVDPEGFVGVEFRIETIDVPRPSRCVVEYQFLEGAVSSGDDLRTEESVEEEQPLLLGEPEPKKPRLDCCREDEV